MYNQEKVNQYYPEAHIYEAMEVWTLPKGKKSQLKKVCDEGKYFAQLKLDGNWYEYNKAPTGKSYLFSRGESKKTGLPTEGIEKVPQIETSMLKIPNDTVILGEIYIPKKTTNEVRSIMGCLPKKAIQRQKESGHVLFYMFDIIRFEGRDLVDVGALERYKILENVYEHFIGCSDYVHLAKNIENDIFDYIIECLSAGEEGVVLKKKDAPYVEGVRTAWSTIKVKKEDTVDLVCIGLEDANIEYTGTDQENWKYWGIFKKVKEVWLLHEKVFGESKCIRSPEFKTIPITKPYYLGLKTALSLGVYKDDKLIKVGTVSSGLTDQYREDITKDPNNYIGRVVECKCMEITKDALRHPIFIRFRDDKKPESCTFNSVFSS